MHALKVLLVAGAAVAWSDVPSLHAQESLLDQHLPLGAPGPDPVVREGYVLSYDAEARMPRWVAYRLRREFLLDTPLDPMTELRVDPGVAAPDPAEGWPTGYKAVRLVPWEATRRADSQLQATVVKQVNSMGNIALMHAKGLGADGGPWKNLQRWVRGDLVSDLGLDVCVIAGCVPGREPQIPALLFQVIYVPQGDPTEVLAFLLPQQHEIHGPFFHFIVPLEVVEAVTGLRFFPDLADRNFRWNRPRPRFARSGEMGIRSVAAAPQVGSADRVEDTRPALKVSVFYGTDRKADTRLLGTNGKISTERDIKRYYGTEQDESQTLHVGVCEVSIPTRPGGKRRARGEIPLPSWWETSNRADHFVLEELVPTEREEFVRRLKNEVAKTKNRQAFVYIHGFNNSFANAAYRTAQMGFDLNVNCVPVMYSWPSKASTGKYKADLKQVDDSRERLKEFLRLVTRETGAEKIHLIAHSMGTRLLSLTLASLHDEGEELPELNQIVLAAPDIDAREFVNEIAPRIENMGVRITIYQSHRDQALYASQYLIHTTEIPRLGLRPVDFSDRPWIQQVDATWVDTSTLGHMYVGDESKLLDDLRAVLDGSDLQKRNLLPTHVLRGKLKKWQSVYRDKTQWWFTWKLLAVLGIGLISGALVNTLRRRRQRT